MPEDRINSGAIFPNDKGDNERRPDQRGRVVILCPHCNRVSKWKLAGWTRKAKNTDQRYLSIALTQETEDNGN